MGKTFSTITPDLADFIAAQAIFFVATAPLSESGHVNLSPKGRDTFRILGDNEVAYLDLTGSGAETIAHVRENARITFMFCSFGTKPKILRLYGTGTIVEPSDDEWTALIAHFDEFPSPRSIITATVHRIADSCGFGVPVMDLVAERDTLDKWANNKSPEALQRYKAEKNTVSLDGLPALRDV